jgi:uncharacterized protein
MAAGAVALGPGFWRDALAAPATPGPGPYGPPVGSPNELGFVLPQGFSSRLIAKGNAPVLGTTYVFPLFPDGSATYPLSDGGWILVSNSEVPLDGQGGASAIRFGPDGEIRDAYRILGGTSTNCAGGKTPWGTWMSCEEVDDGHVWECDPAGEKPAIERPAMGTFKHEAVAVDPAGKRVYLTEDQGDGGFYRFTPARYPDCSRGTLEVARVEAGGVVRWIAVPDPSAASTPTRQQVAITPFRRGEGIWFDGGIIYVATTSDNKIHAYDPATEKIDVLYDQTVGDGPLNGVDNVTAAPSGDIYVAEDNGTNQIDIGLLTPEGEVARFLTATGPQHEQSELTGVTFDPSGKRMFFSSQRSFGGPGAVFEVTGPFRERGPTAPVGDALRLSANAGRTARIEKFGRKGMTVELTANRDVRAKVSVRAELDGRDLQLARSYADLKAGKPQRVVVEPKSSTPGRLRGRTSVTARIVASAKHAPTGATDSLTRGLALVATKR